MKILLFFVINFSLDIIASRKIVQGTKKEPLKAESAFLNNELFRPEYVPIYEQEELQQENPECQQLFVNSHQAQNLQDVDHNTPQLDHQHYTFQQQRQLLLASDPLLAAAVLSQTLGIPTTATTHGQNHPQHPMPNPYVSLLLSHYGRYISPHHSPGRTGRGIYGYAAANNLHNNQPFGAYKLYKDIDV